MDKKLSAEVQVRIPFHDCDMMRIVWHGHYTKYFEIARCALFDLIGFNYAEMEASGYSWPIVECHLKYIRPARFGSLLRVSAMLTEYDNRLGIDYLISDETSGDRLTKGYSRQVAVDMSNGELLFATPQVLVEKIECALRAL